MYTILLSNMINYIILQTPIRGLTFVQIFLPSGRLLEDHVSPRGWLLQNHVSGLEKQWEVDMCYGRVWRERIMLDRDSEAVRGRGYFGCCYKEVQVAWEARHRDRGRLGRACVWGLLGREDTWGDSLWSRLQRSVFFSSLGGIFGRQFFLET